MTVDGVSSKVHNSGYNGACDAIKRDEMNIVFFNFARGVHTSPIIRHSSLMTKFGLAGEAPAFIAPEIMRTIALYRYI